MILSFMLLQINLIEVAFTNSKVWAANRFPTGEVFSWFQQRGIERGRDWCFIQGNLIEMVDSESGIIFIRDSAVANDFTLEFRSTQEG